MTLWNQFTWNDASPWEPAVITNPFLLNLKPTNNRMKRQEYYPARVEAQPEWLENFAEKLLIHAATLGVTNTRRDAAVLDALWLKYVIGSWAPAARAWADSVTDVVVDAGGGTGSSAMVLPAFIAPPLPAAAAPLPATVAVAPGGLDRIFKLVKDIKNATGLTDAIASEMRIVGDETSPDANPVPKLSLKVEQGPTCQCVRIKFIKYGRTGVYLESRRNGGAWEFLASPVRSPYTDNRALLSATAAEIREYRARYWENNAPTGDWTDVAKVTVAP